MFWTVRISKPRNPRHLDTILLFSAGGGGFGPIEERSAEQIKKDVIRGYVSPEAAEKEYGLSSADLTTRLMITMA